MGNSLSAQTTRTHYQRSRRRKGAPVLFQKGSLSAIQQELESKGELGPRAIKGIIDGLRDSHAYTSSGTPAK